MTSDDDTAGGAAQGAGRGRLYESDYLMPHRGAAWALLAERLDEAAGLCEELQAQRGQRIAGRLEPVGAALRELAQTLAGHLPAESSHARRSFGPAAVTPAELDSLLASARELAQTVAGARRDCDERRGLAEVFDAAAAVVTAVASGSAPGATRHSGVAARICTSVLRPLADALGRSPTGAGSGVPGGSAGGSVSGGAAGGSASDGARATERGGQVAAAPPPGIPDLVWEAAKTATRLRVRLAEAGGVRPELAEATAALRRVPVRALAEQALLQRHALVRRVPRPGARTRPRADALRVGRRVSRAGPDDPVAVRKARSRRPLAGSRVREHAGRPSPVGGKSFAAHIQPMFRPRDRQSMTFAFDLWSHDDVKAHAPDILERLRNGSMPCDGAWADDKILLFQRWAESGRQP